MKILASTYLPSRRNHPHLVKDLITLDTGVTLCNPVIFRKSIESDVPASPPQADSRKSSIDVDVEGSSGTIAYAPQRRLPSAFPNLSAPKALAGDPPAPAVRRRGRRWSISSLTSAPSKLSSSSTNPNSEVASLDSQIGSEPLWRSEASAENSVQDESPKAHRQLVLRRIPSVGHVVRRSSLVRAAMTNARPGHRPSLDLPRVPGASSDPPSERMSPPSKAHFGRRSHTRTTDSPHRMSSETLPFMCAPGPDPFRPRPVSVEPVELHRGPIVSRPRTSASPARDRARSNQAAPPSSGHERNVFYPRLQSSVSLTPTKLIAFPNEPSLPVRDWRIPTTPARATNTLNQLLARMERELSVSTQSIYEGTSASAAGCVSGLRKGDPQPTDIHAWQEDSRSVDPGLGLGQLPPSLRSPTLVQAAPLPPSHPHNSNADILADRALSVRVSRVKAQAEPRAEPYIRRKRENGILATSPLLMSN